VYWTSYTVCSSNAGLFYSETKLRCWITTDCAARFTVLSSSLIYIYIYSKRTRWIVCLKFSIGLFILKTNIPCFGLIYRLSPDLPLDSLINPPCNPPNSAIQVSRIEGCSKPWTVILLACSLQRGMLAHWHVTVLFYAVKMVVVVFHKHVWCWS